MKKILFRGFQGEMLFMPEAPYGIQSDITLCGGNFKQAVYERVTQFDRNQSSGDDKTEVKEYIG